MAPQPCRSLTGSRAQPCSVSWARPPAQSLPIAAREDGGAAIDLVLQCLKPAEQLQRRQRCLYRVSMAGSG